MYQVHQEREGKNGVFDMHGRLWENGHGHPKFEVVWYGRRKAEAIQAADACAMRAVVTLAYMSESIYDNGKPPGRRERDMRTEIRPAGV